jgi:serine/threonine protein kinase
VKWAATEVIKDGTFSAKSDVWAFGIMMWELFSYGATPYGQWNNAETAENVLSGYRLSCPEGCPENIFNLIRRCWDEDQAKRPTFTEIVENLEICVSKFKPYFRTPQSSLPEIILASKGSFYTLEEKKIYSSMKEFKSEIVVS